MSDARTWTIAFTVLLSVGRVAQPVAPGKPSVAMHCDTSRSKSVVATIRYRLHKIELDSTRLEFSDSASGFQTARRVSVHVRRSGGSRLIRRDGRFLRGELVGASIHTDSVVVQLKTLEIGLDYVWRVVVLDGHAAVVS